MLDPRGQLLCAALGFAGCSMPSYDRTLHALRSWLDSWSGIGRVAVGMAHQGLRPPTDPLRREGLARDLLHDRDGALADERDGHRMGAYAVARDASRGAEGVKEQRPMTACARKHDYVATGPGSPVARHIV